MPCPWRPQRTALVCNTKLAQRQSCLWGCSISLKFQTDFPLPPKFCWTRSRWWLRVIPAGQRLHSKTTKYKMDEEMAKNLDSHLSLVCKGPWAGVEWQSKNDIPPQLPKHKFKLYWRLPSVDPAVTRYLVIQAVESKASEQDTRHVTPLFGTDYCNENTVGLRMSLSLTKGPHKVTVMHK